MIGPHWVSGRIDFLTLQDLLESERFNKAHAWVGDVGVVVGMVVGMGVVASEMSSGMRGRDGDPFKGMRARKFLTLQDLVESCRFHQVWASSSI